MANLGVEALLNWFNSLELTEQPLHIDDLQDGTYLLKVVNKLKNEQDVSLDLSVEERFNRITSFLEGDCRLRAGIGAALSRHIANGNNLTIEITKVLLLLVYYDMMNNRSTLNNMEFKVEREIASLTDRFVLETDGCVYLSNGIEAYLGRKYFPYLSVQSGESDTSSPSTQSSSSLQSDDSPLFFRSQKVNFVDLHTVASPAVSMSPLQEVMNTPRFKLRKMQTQIIQEREYRDGLTRELASMLAQSTKRETHINQLQYHLDKVKENQNVQDQVASDEINELETKNESLQRRLHELARQNHDLKSDTIQMERKVDQLTEEKGNLSVQVREICLKLATSEAELGRLMENQATVEKELQSQTCYLQAELSQATAQKEFQNEQIQILQGKISSLEEELCRVSVEEKGENMGPVMQREELENEITELKDQLEIAMGSLREAEQVVQAKEVMLAQYQEDITLHKELLKQQVAKSEKEIQAKQELIDQMQKDIAEQRHILQQEKYNLQLQVDGISALLKKSQEDAQLKEEQMLQANTRHDAALEQQKTFYEDQMGRLKEEIQQKQEKIDLLKDRTEKVELLNQEMQTLRNQVETLTFSLMKAEEYLQTKEDLLAKQQLDSLTIQETLQKKVSMFQEEVHGLWVEEAALQAEVKLAKETIQVKEDMFANLQMENSQQTDVLKGEMHSLEGQVKTITTTLSNAKQELKTQQDMCSLHQQEHAQQLEELQKQLFASKEEIERLIPEIIQKEQQLANVKTESSAHSDGLQQEINSLRSHVDSATDSLRKAEEKLQDRETLLTQQEQESAHQKELLQKQVFACEEEVDKMKREIKTKEEQLTLLALNGSEQSALLQQQIQGLTSQVESLSSSLKQTEEEVLAQKHQELESTQQMEALQQLNLVSEENIRLLKEEIQTKETILNEIRTESSKQSENLAHEIQNLTLEMDNTKESLKMATEEVQAKEDLLANLRQERDQHKTTMDVCEEEKALLGQEILLKEQQLTEVKTESSAHSDGLQQEINGLRSQVDSVTNSLRKAEEKLQDRETLLTQQEQESAHQKELLQKQVFACEEEVEKMKREITTKEEQLTVLGLNGSEQSALLQQQIQGLTSQVESLSSSLKQTEEEVLAQKHQELESTQQMEALQQLNLVSEENIRLLKEEIQTKETILNVIRTESSKQSENLANEIQNLTLEMDKTKESLKMATEEVQAKEDLLANLRQERDQHKTTMDVCEEEKALLRQEILLKEQQLANVKTESSAHSDGLQQEINSLRSQVDSVTDSLRKAEEKLQDRETLLTQQEQESAHQKELLQKQVFACEEEVDKMKREITTKEEQLTVLGLNGSEQSALLQQQIQGLTSQVESLSSSLKQTEEEVLSQKHQLSKHELESTQQMEALQQLNLVSEENIRLLKEEIQTKETILNVIRTESSKQSENLANEIQTLTLEMENTKESLKMATEEVQAKEDLLANLRQERDQHKTTMDVCEEEKALLRQEILLKEQQLTEVKTESSAHSDGLQQEINSLRSQVDSVTDSLRKAEEKLQDRETLLTQQEQESAHQKELLQIKVSASEEEVEMLKQEINSKEEQLTLLGLNGSEQTALLQQKIQGLTSKVESLSFSLEEAEKEVQAKEELLTEEQQAGIQQREVLQKQVVASQEDVKRLNEDIQTQEEQLTTQQKLFQQKLFVSQEDVQRLRQELEAKEEEVCSKETLLAKNQEEDVQQKMLMQQQIDSSLGEIQKVKESLRRSEDRLHQVTEKNKGHQNELSSLLSISADKDKQLSDLREEVTVQIDLQGKAKTELQAKEHLLAKVQDDFSKGRENHEHEVRNLKVKIVTINDSLQKAEDMALAKEQLMMSNHQESAQQVDLLKQQLESVNIYLSHSKEAGATGQQQKAALQELQATTLIEKETLIHETEALRNRLLLAEQCRKTLEKELELQSLEKEKLVQARVSMERENKACRKLESALQQELASLRNDKERLVEEITKALEWEKLGKGLQEQLTTKSEAAEHYKTQMENAMSHYNAKKKLLRESQEHVAEMQRSLDVKETIATELKLLQLDFDNVQSNEKNLLSRVTSLETQLAFADGQLREHNKMRGDGGRLQDIYFTAADENRKIQNRELKEENHDSSDSQGDNTLEDSLNTTRRPSAPGESSTPLVRSSERLAGKRRALGAESLESLYFTPMNNKQTNRTKRHMDDSLTSLAELPDSTLKNPPSSVKRRRTTQVINITMSKKTPGRGGPDNDHHRHHGDDDDTFYSLASARSHPNLSNSHATRPVSMELFSTPSGKTAAASDQLLSLPGYRRSTASTTAPSRSTSTFCVGAENEPENGPDDWMRIAELQARNKACLPHLKSSYPLESRPSIGPEFIITDDDLRMGDPTDTIRRATLMPGQMLDSLSSHRLSYMVGQKGTAGTRAHRHSLMPGQLPTRTNSSSSLQMYPLSPETKVKTSCFPRPLTPKNKNINMGSSSTLIRTALSPVQRRESMVFTIDNTPKKNNYLQKGLNRLRSSTRKSPGKGVKKSPAQRASGRSPGNRAAEVGVSTARRGSTRALPQGAAAAKGQRKSPRTSAKSTTKSPGLTASARKMMSFRMKV